MNKSLKNILRGSSTIALMTLAAAILGFFIRIMLTRKLSLEDFGLFYAVLAFLAPVGLLKNLGVNKAVTKFLPEFMVKGEWENIKESIHWAIIVSIGTSLIAVSTFFLLADWLGAVYFNTDKAAPFLKIMLLYFLISTLGGVFSAFFNGMKKPLLLSSRAVLINVLILLWVYLANDLNVIFIAHINIVAEVIVLAFLILMFFQVFDYFNISSSMSMSGLKKLFSYGLPATTTPIVNKVFGRLDIVVLTYFKSLSEVGIYSAAQPFARLFAIIGSSVGKMIFPYSSEVFSLGKKGELKEIIGQLQRMLLFILAPIAVIFIVFCGDFLLHIFGRQFQEGSLVVRLLVVGGLIHTLTIINVNVLNGIGHPLKVTKLVALNSSLNLGGNILFIPIWGMGGAAVSTLISNWMMFWGSCLYIKSLVGYRFNWGFLVRILFSALIMIAVLLTAQLYIADNLLILFTVFVPLSFISYLSISLFLRVIRKVEVQWVIQKLKNILGAPHLSKNYDDKKLDETPKRHPIK
ncbi:flippase [Thermodesulfobacteriota bacterium]